MEPESHSTLFNTYLTSVRRINRTRRCARMKRNALGWCVRARGRVAHLPAPLRWSPEGRRPEGRAPAEWDCASPDIGREGDPPRRACGLPGDGEGRLMGELGTLPRNCECSAKERATKGHPVSPIPGTPKNNVTHSMAGSTLRAAPPRPSCTRCVSHTLPCATRPPLPQQSTHQPLTTNGGSPRRTCGNRDGLVARPDSRTSAGISSVDTFSDTPSRSTESADTDVRATRSSVPSRSDTDVATGTGGAAGAGASGRTATPWGPAAGSRDAALASLTTLLVARPGTALLSSAYASCAALDSGAAGMAHGTTAGGTSMGFLC